jgi:hypothetical protein
MSSACTFPDPLGEHSVGYHPGLREPPQNAERGDDHANKDQRLRIHLL